MTELAELRDRKVDISTRNMLYSFPGIPEILTGADVVSQNISIDLIYNRKISLLLADNPDSTEEHLQSIAGWVEEDPFVINGTAKVELEYVSLSRQNILITADLHNEAELNLELAV